MRCALFLVLLFALPSHAQTYPDKPLRLVIAFPPGGITDLFARAFQPRLAEGLGQPLVIENRPGAGGTIAEALVAKAPADGYTLLMNGDNSAANPHLYRDLSYDLFRDLAPLTIIARVPHVLIANPSVPASTLQEFVAYAKSHQGQVSYGSPGTGTGSHLYLELFKNSAGIDLTHVPYKGGVPAMNDLIGGHIQAVLISITLAAPQVRSGKLRALGVGGGKRAPLLPQVPTFAEAGYPDVSPQTWTGLYLPAGTPPAIVHRLYQEFAKALRFPEVEARFAELGAEIVLNTPSEFSAVLRAESERLGKVIRDRNITPN